MLKAFRNKGTKLMAAMVAMVMVIGVAKVPVKASQIGSVNVNEDGVVYSYKLYYDLYEGHLWDNLKLGGSNTYHSNGVSRVGKTVTNGNVSFSYTPTSYNMSTGFGHIGNQAVVDRTLALGYGNANGVYFNSSVYYGLTYYIESSDPTGDYNLFPYTYHYKCHWDKYYSNGNPTYNLRYYYMPSNSRKVAVAYTSNNYSWTMVR